MRKTRLKHATLAVAFVLAGGAVLTGALRALVVAGDTAGPTPGAALFREKGCAQCHHTESRHTKIGPGLAGLLSREELPVSGRLATEENVRHQLREPYDRMPSFADRLTVEQEDLLIVYLETL